MIEVTFQFKNKQQAENFCMNERENFANLIIVIDRGCNVTVTSFDEIMYLKNTLPEKYKRLQELWV